MNAPAAWQRILHRLAVPRARIDEALARLQPRERRMVSIAAVGGMVALVWVGLVEPLTGSLGTTQRDLERTRKEADLVAALARTASELQAEVAARERGGPNDANEASLFAQLESIAVPAIGRERVSALTPSTRTVGDGLVEESVEMKLDGVTMRELVSLLHSVELSGRPVRISRLSFKRQYKSQERLDAILVVARRRAR